MESQIKTNDSDRVSKQLWFESICPGLSCSTLAMHGHKEQKETICAIQIQYSTVQ